MNQVKTIEETSLVELGNSLLEALNDNWTPIGGVFQPEDEGTLCMILTKTI